MFKSFALALVHTCYSSLLISLITFNNLLLSCRQHSANPRDGRCWHASSHGAAFAPHSAPTPYPNGPSCLCLWRHGYICHDRQLQANTLHGTQRAWHDGGEEVRLWESTAQLCHAGCSRGHTLCKVTTLSAMPHTQVYGLLACEPHHSASLLAALQSDSRDDVLQGIDRHVWRCV